MKLHALDPLVHPQYDDMLHKESQFIEHFYHLIALSIDPPFAISVDGIWGTGKTTVMQLLRSKLRERDGGYPVFWFNPWEYQEAESIVLAFLQCLAKEAETEIESTRQEGLKLLGIVGVLGMNVAMNALMKPLVNLSIADIRRTGEDCENERKKIYEKYQNIIKVIQEDFKTLINTIAEQYHNKPVIIFFDDLDRCLPDKAIQLLEAVKNLFVIPGTEVIFVCGIDTRIAKQFIKSHYKDIEENFAINYFRKIFNLTLSMPHSHNIQELLIKHIKDLRTPEKQEAEEQEVMGLANTVYDLGRQAGMLSVRKYLNVANNFYTFQQFNPTCTNTDELNFVLHLLIVKEAWQPLYERIAETALSEGVPINMSALIGKILESDYHFQGKQQKFLPTHFVNNSSFSNINLVNDFLDKYSLLF